MSARNRFASMCLCVVRAAVRAPAPLPSSRTPKSQGVSFKCCRSSFCLARGLWVAVFCGETQRVAPHHHPLSLTPLCFGGASLGSRSFCANEAPGMRGPRGKDQQCLPGPCLFYALIYWGSYLVPIASVLSCSRPGVPVG